MILHHSLIHVLVCTKSGADIHEKRYMTSVLSCSLGTRYDSLGICHSSLWHDDLSTGHLSNRFKNLSDFLNWYTENDSFLAWIPAAPISMLFYNDFSGFLTKPSLGEWQRWQISSFSQSMDSLICTLVGEQRMTIWQKGKITHIAFSVKNLGQGCQVISYVKKRRFSPKFIICILCIHLCLMKRLNAIFSFVFCNLFRLNTL